MSTNATPSIAFRPGDHIVYPAHGVGRVMGVEQQSVAGIALDVLARNGRLIFASGHHFRNA